MVKTMSLTTRRELLNSVRQRYENSDWNYKGRVLDGFIAATGYERKYAIRLLNSIEAPTVAKKRHGSQKYNVQVQQALITIWCAANQICSKRLVPFLPQFIDAMERHGHLRLPNYVRASAVVTLTGHF